MRRIALTALGAALLLAAVATSARGHLVPSGSDTLLGLLAAADGVVVARSAAATHERDASSAATPFLAREIVAGVGPTGGFVLDQQAPILRYAELQDAVLLVARRQEGGASPRWLSVQPAGAAILIEGGGLGDGTRAVLTRLWTVAHPPAGAAKDADHGVDALVQALSVPEAKLRALAFLDLSRLAADRDHFSAAAVARLTSYGDQPGDDPQLAPAVRDLGNKLGGGVVTRATRAAEQGAKP